MELTVIDLALRKDVLIIGGLKRPAGVSFSRQPDVFPLGPDIGTTAASCGGEIRNIVPRVAGTLTETSQVIRAGSIWYVLMA